MEPLKKVRVAVFGLGIRGRTLLSQLIAMDDVEVKAVCDPLDERVKKALDLIREKTGVEADGYADHIPVIERKDIDAVVIATTWITHVRIAVAAMKSGKYVAFEAGGAASVKECWKLVETSEETGMPCMMLENACYERRPMALIHMAKIGLFGDLIHFEAAYAHDLRDEIVLGIQNKHGRFRNFQHRNGDLYPTHDLGPIMNMLDINRGNRLMTLVSMSSKSLGLHQWSERYKPEHADVNWNEGDVVTTMIKCANGESIILKHDCSLPRPTGNHFLVQGTKGLANTQEKGVFIDNMEGPMPPLYASEGFKYSPLDEYLDKYEHPLWKWYKQHGVRGNHGGADYLTLRAYVESVKNRTQTPLDVYDSALLASITCLSEESIAMGCHPVAIPDFTNGLWIDRPAETPTKYSLFSLFPDLY